ncbi:MAG: hypothetical protein R2788_07730 [Saprospiraceae bacterium]
MKEELSFDILQLARHWVSALLFPTQTLFIEEMPGKGNTTPFMRRMGRCWMEIEAVF